jgi:hypothetical protein
MGSGSGLGTRGSGLIARDGGNTRNAGAISSTGLGARARRPKVTSYTVFSNIIHNKRTFL